MPAGLGGGLNPALRGPGGPGPTGVMMMMMVTMMTMMVMMEMVLIQGMVKAVYCP